MRKIFTQLLIIVFFTSAIANNVFAADRITGDLHQKLENSAPGEMIRINITLNEKFDSQALIREAQTKSPSERRSYVISVLKSFTQLSQKGVLAQINTFQRSQQIKKVTTYWIANVINCYATPAAIRQLANRNDIASIDYDEYRIVLEPREYENRKFEPAHPDSREITWNVLKINADDVWALGFNGEGVIVSVIDTGVNYNHVDLNDHVWEDPDYPNHGYDFANNDNDPMDDHGHGTHCSGTVAGDGTAGSQTGVAPEATIMCCKVLDSGGGGNESDVWDAIEFSVEHGANVLSLSLGWQHSWNPNRSVWRQTFDNALAAGVIASVAAGNEGDQQGSYPIPDNVRTPGDLPPPWLHPDQTLTGGVSGIICVGATNSSDNVAGFSSRGPLDWSAIAPYNDYPYNPEMGLIRPDICSPGVDIKSLAYNSNTGYESGWNGTSMATPANAGMIALMLQKNPNLTPADIDETIEETAVVLSPGKNNTSGSGRIDALAAIEATSFPGPSYYSHTINDPSGNNNGELDPGESVTLTLAMANFSDETFNNVTVDLSTESEFITITDGTEYFGNFAMEDIIEIEDAFAFDVANDIPGGEAVKFIVTAHNDDETWESSFTVTANGVLFTITDFTIVDYSGNNNGGLDPGETADILIETTNAGQIDAPGATATLTSSDPDITINSASFDFGTLEAGESATATFNITVSGNAQIGSSVELVYELTSGYYDFINSFFPKVGMIVEDFETGDFSSFDWEFAGEANWSVVNSGAWEGTYAARSGVIGDSQSSEMKLTLDIVSPDTIAFYRKVSSEATYDFLKFYIDNTEVAEWSGEVAWSREAFPVSQGEHTLRWVYIKDVWVSAGDDCAWVDFIELPAFDDGTMSVFAGNDDTVCEGTDYQTNATAQNFSTLLWGTSGTGTFDNASALNAVYTPSQQDYEAGAVTLTLTVYAAGGSSMTDDMELGFAFLPDAAGEISGDDMACMGGVNNYSAEEIQNADTYEWVLTPHLAGEISGNGTDITINWSDSYTGTVTLKVRGENICGTGEFSEPFEIEIDDCTGIDENTSKLQMEITPNPNNGSFVLNLKNNPSGSTIKILDLTGKVVYEQKNEPGNKLFINASNLENGIYFLLVENTTGRKIEKFIVQN
jgi:subtilisin family serine protease